MRKTSLLLLALMVLSAASCSRAPPKASAAPPGPGQAVRLADVVTPASYRIAIVPDAARLTFKGSVQIAVDVKAQVRSITLNALDLVFDRTTLDGVPAAKVVLNAGAQTATLSFDRDVKPGRHALAIDYHGQIYQHSAGLFALDYGSGAAARRMLVTQFESADARRFTPSWDEPARKAALELTVTVPADQLAVSNTPEASSRPLPGGLKQVTFQPTPKMSPYLLFLAVGDLERVSRKVDGVDVGVVVRRGAAAKARYALDAASEELRWYDAYFGIPYPLAKLDLVAAPGAGGFGAMENWGAILFFEDRILIDPKLSNEGDRRDVSVVIAHEVSHQWFGDLVTMAWWDDLWLNESFANWMEAKAVDSLHPDWRVWLDEARGKERAFRLDATSATHPVVQPAETMDQVEEIGDALTYDKGAAVIRMLEAYVGPDAWRAGVQAYLRKHAYGNSTHADLWAEIETASKRPVAAIARDFIEQEGVPVVGVDIMVGQEPGSAVLLTQERLVADHGVAAEGAWHIPVTARPIAGGVESHATVRAGPLIQALHSISPGPLVVNAGQVGYYRTLYAPSALKPLADRMARLDPADQLGLIADAWALGEAGDEPASDALMLIARLPADAEAGVWIQALDTLSRVDELYDGLPGQAAFRAWARARLRPVLARVGWGARSSRADTLAVLRAELLVTLGDLDDPQVAAEAKVRFQRFLKDPSSLSPDIRQAVLRIAGRHADASTFEALRRLARAATDPQEQRQYLEALSRAKDPDIARRALDLSLSNEAPTTIGPVMIRTVAVEHPDLAWAFALAHAKALEPRLDPSQTVTFTPGLLRSTNDVAWADRLRDYTIKTYPPGSRRESGKIEAGIRQRAEIRRLRLPDIDRWLAARES